MIVVVGVASGVGAGVLRLHARREALDLTRRAVRLRSRVVRDLVAVVNGTLARIELVAGAQDGLARGIRTCVFPGVGGGRGLS